MNASWNSGYVADIAYIEGFYVQQSPARLALACLFGNVNAEMPGQHDDASYLELGCGVGIGAPAHGGVQSRLASHGHRLQSGPHRDRQQPRARCPPGEYPLHRSRPRAARR